MLWDRAAAAASDSERNQERSCGKRAFMARLAARADVRDKRGEPVAPDGYRMLRVRAHAASGDVLPDERRRIGQDVVAAADATHHRRCVLMVTSARGGSRRVTLDHAPQRGAVSHGQDEGDRNNSGSQHVNARSQRAAKRRPTTRVVSRRETRQFLHMFDACGPSPLRIRAGCREKFPGECNRAAADRPHLTASRLAWSVPRRALRDV